MAHYIEWALLNAFTVTTLPAISVPAASRVRSAGRFADRRTLSRRNRRCCVLPPPSRRPRRGRTSGRPSSRLRQDVQAAQKGPDARRRPRAARETYSLYVERAAAGANEADGPFSAAGEDRAGRSTIAAPAPGNRLSASTSLTSTRPGATAPCSARVAVVPAGTARRRSRAAGAAHRPTPRGSAPHSCR